MKKLLSIFVLAASILSTKAAAVPFPSFDTNQFTLTTNAPYVLVSISTNLAGGTNTYIFNTTINTNIYSTYIFVTNISAMNIQGSNGFLAKFVGNGSSLSNSIAYETNSQLVVNGTNGPADWGVYTPGWFATTNRLNGPVNAMNFAGVDPTGATDSTAGLQTALDSVTNGFLFIPSGTYVVSSLTMPENGLFGIIGTASTVLQASPLATNSMFLISGSAPGHILFRDIVLDGNWQNIPHSQLTNIVNGCALVCAINPNLTLETDNVTFTNTARAGIRFAGNILDFHDSRMLNMMTNTCDGFGSPGYPYGIYAQPTEHGPDMLISVKNSVFKSAVGADTNLVYLSGSGVFITEQANMGNPLDNTNRYRFNIVGNEFYGVGGWFSESEGAAIETYNGADGGVVMANLIDTYAQSAIKMQRTANVVVKGNHIRNGCNGYTGLGGIYTGVSDAIIFAPNAREGVSPFTGVRLGEKHYNAVIAGNVVLNFQQTAVYCTGEDVLIEDNIFAGRFDGPAPPSAVAILASNVEVKNNKFIDIPDYCVAATGTYSNIVVRGNSYLARSITNKNGLFLFQNISDLDFRDNTGYLAPGNSGSFFYVDACTNVKCFNNDVALNSLSAVALAVSSTNVQAQVVEFNNSWQRGQWRQTQNGLTTFEAANLLDTPSSLAGAGQRVRSADSGGGIYAWPYSYAGIGSAGYVELANDSNAKGAQIQLYASTNYFRVNAGVKTILSQYGNGDMTLIGASTAPLITDTDNLTANYTVHRLGGVNKGYFGYSAGYNGYVWINGAGAIVNMYLEDATGTIVPLFCRPANLTANKIVQTDGTGTLVSVANAVGFLSNDGSGGLTWAVPGGGTNGYGFLAPLYQSSTNVGITLNTSGRLMYNNAGVFGNAPWQMRADTNTLGFNSGDAMFFYRPSDYSLAIGGESMTNGTGASVAVGFRALKSTTTGYNNTAVGFGALEYVTSGNGNTGIGQHALNTLTTGSDNIAIGDSSMPNTTGGRNTAIGTLSGWTNITGANNVFIGYNANSTNDSDNNTVIIGSEATGHGANTVTLGNPSMTELWLGTNQVYPAGAQITISKGGSDIGTRPKINLIEGANTTINVADNPGANRVDVTVAASGITPPSYTYNISYFHPTGNTNYVGTDGSTNFAQINIGGAVFGILLPSPGTYEVTAWVPLRLPGSYNCALRFKNNTAGAFDAAYWIHDTAEMGNARDITMKSFITTASPNNTIAVWGANDDIVYSSTYVVETPWISYVKVH